MYRCHRSGGSITWRALSAMTLSFSAPGSAIASAPLVAHDVGREHVFEDFPGPCPIFSSKTRRHPSRAPRPPCGLSFSLIGLEQAHRADAAAANQVRQRRPRVCDLAVPGVAAKLLDDLVDHRQPAPPAGMAAGAQATL